MEGIKMAKEKKAKEKKMKAKEGERFWLFKKFDELGWTLRMLIKTKWRNLKKGVTEDELYNLFYRDFFNVPARFGRRYIVDPKMENYI